MCGFDPHSNPEIFSLEKKYLRTHIQVLQFILDELGLIICIINLCKQHCTCSWWRSILCIAHESSIYFYSKSSFINNSCSNTGGAILAINSKVHFLNKHNLSNNSALQGGAISLQYNSQLFLHQNTILIFLENMAQSGAVIHVIDILSSIDCMN